MGIFKLGNLIKFIPSTITTGFTSGIAVTILIGQIKDFMGLTFPEGAHAVETMFGVNYASPEHEYAAVIAKAREYHRHQCMAQDRQARKTCAAGVSGTVFDGNLHRIPRAVPSGMVAGTPHRLDVL